MTEVLARYGRTGPNREAAKSRRLHAAKLELDRLYRECGAGVMRSLLHAVNERRVEGDHRHDLGLYSEVARIDAAPGALSERVETRARVLRETCGVASAFGGLTALESVCQPLRHRADPAGDAPGGVEAREWLSSALADLLG